MRYGYIDAQQLKALIDAESDFTLIDARGTNWHDANTIPGALLASYQESAEDFAALIPDLDSPVVVYCFSSRCPLSQKLANKLADLGYTHIAEYKAGLKEWRDQLGYPVAELEALPEAATE